MGIHVLKCFGTVLLAAVVVAICYGFDVPPSASAGLVILFAVIYPPKVLR